MELTSTIARPADIVSDRANTTETAAEPLPAIATGQQTIQDVFTALMPADWRLDADGKLYTPVPMFTDPDRVPKGFANALTSLNWADILTLEERTETREGTERTVLWMKALFTGECFSVVVEPEGAAELRGIRTALCERMIGAIERRLHS